MSQQKDQLRTIFSMFSDEDGLIPESKIPRALACARCVYSPASLPATGSVDYRTFTELVREFTGPSGIMREQIESAFKVFDPEDTGYISAGQLKQILQSGENALSAADAQYLVDHFGVDDRGMVCHRLLVEKLYGK